MFNIICSIVKWNIGLLEYQTHITLTLRLFDYLVHNSHGYDNKITDRTTDYHVVSHSEQAHVPLYISY